MQGPAARDRSASALRGALAWGVVAACFGGLVAGLEPNLLEEGIVVHAAERMAGGEHLFRDIVLFTAPLPYELLALIFRVVGSEIAAARVAVVALQALAAGLLFACARRAGLRAGAHAVGAAMAAAPPLLVPLLSTFFYTTLAWYFAVCALAAALRGTQSRASALAAGALVGVVALCKQHTGVILAVAFVPGLWLGTPAGSRIARLRDYAAGGAIMAIATLALYALRGDLAALWRAQVELPLALSGIQSYATRFMNLWPPGELDPVSAGQFSLYAPSLYTTLFGFRVAPGIVVISQLLYALPFFALAATLVRALPVFPRAHPLVWLHGALLLAMTANLYPRPDWGHLYVALPPALVQLLLLPASAAPRTHPRERPLASAFAVGLAGALLLGSLWTALSLRNISGDPQLGPRVPLRPVSYANRTPGLQRVMDWLLPRVTPGEPIFVPRQEPLLYFATRTKNPTPFPGVLPGLRELQEPIILPALDGVRFVVMSDLDQPAHTYYRDELPGVQAYLERHFQIPHDFPLDDYTWIFVLERGPDLGEDALDLIALRPQARGFVRDADGALRESSEPLPRLGSRQLMRPLPIPLGPHGGGVDYDLLIPPDATFRGAVGYWALAAVDHQYLHSPGGRVVASIGRDGQFEEIAAVEYNDRFWPARQWLPLRADLSRFAGQRVTLRLELRSEQEILPEHRMSWWGSPRITVDGSR
ncbi:MAG TPA: hypothetical protein VFY49_19895 [Myxococcota bacterium]|nr:hypothetical protein [Myxococcota bacterium]